MTYSANIVLDTTVVGGQVYATQRFSKPRFVVIDTTALSLTQAYELGFSLVVEIPVIGRTITKNIALLPEQLRGVFDTFYIVNIPSALYESPYECYCTIALSLDAANAPIRIYVFTSDITEETTQQSLQEINDKLDALQVGQTLDLAEDAAQIVNSVQNNIAFGILSTSLVPITGGTSTAALPPLATGTAVLSPLLLAGFLP